MAGLPFALYFPYIDLDGELLKEFLTLFKGIALLQPSFSAPGSTTEEAEKLDWVRIHRPLSVNLAAKGVRAMLQDFERLGALYQDSGYLAYLKHGGAHRLEDEPGYELIREIRNYGKAPSPSEDQERLRGQLLLQMAQDLDRQRREIQEALSELHEQERSLHRQLTQDADDAEAAAWELGPLPGPEEDDFLIPQRLGAWAELRGAFVEEPPPLLLTDNHLVMDHLLEKAAGLLVPGGIREPLALMQLSLPRFVPADLSEVRRIREGIEELLPWQVFCEKLEALLGEVRLAPWSPETAREAAAKGRALASYFQEAVMDPLLEKWAALEPSWNKGWRQATLEAVLFPGLTELELLRGTRGPSHPAGDGHAVVLHWDEGAPIDFTQASR